MSGDVATSRSTRKYWFATLPLAVALGAGVLAHLIPAACRPFQFLATFAGHQQRLAEGMQTRGCRDLTFAEAQFSALITFVLVLLIAAMLFLLLRFWWPKAWRTRPLTEPLITKVVKFVPVLGGLVAAAGSAVLYFGIRETPDGVVTVTSEALTALVALGWAAAVALIASLILAANATLGGWGKRKVDAVAMDDLRTDEYLWDPSKEVSGLGIACSGGGIRAASFAIGVLSVLDRNKPGVKPGNQESTPTPDQPSILDRASYIASVSGGGYTAGAWRMARGSDETSVSWQNGVVGKVKWVDRDPHVDEPGQEASSLYEHFMSRRRFPTAGRGGLPVSLLMVFLSVLLQVAILLLLIWALAWPLGRVASSFAVTDGSPGSGIELTWRFFGPVVSVLGIGAIAALVRSFLKRTERRSLVDSVVIGAVATSVGVSIPLLLVPGILWALAQRSITDWLVAGAAVLTGAVGAIVLPLIVAQLKSIWIYLGGVFLALALALVTVLLIDWAASIDAEGWEWWIGYGAILGLLWMSSYFLKPRTWSLHNIYRLRIRDAFATTTDGEQAASFRVRRRVNETSGEARLYPVRPRNEPMLSDYVEAPGPSPVICASVARRSKTGTGTPALSFVLEPDCVTMYDVDRTPESGRRIYEYRCNTAEYFGSRADENPRPVLGAMTTAMAVSGAAFAPAMGQFSLGTTNALLATLNVRLGAWLPNPIYGDGRVGKPRLNYFFKEILGWYDEKNDPHVYVTDGGHRENLGLLELLRRRCQFIICIDASGDPPDSLATLLRAVRLAPIECAAEIDIDDEDLADLQTVPLGGLPRRSFMCSEILYKDKKDGNEVSGKGKLLYIKALVSQESSIDLKAFKQEDPTFPDYSTGNQLLNDEQVTYIARLGEEIAEEALRFLIGENIDLLPIGEDIDPP